MISALIGLIAGCISMLAICGYLEWRNELVYAVRQRAIQKCKEKGTEFIRQGKPWRMAWAPFEDGPSYVRMIFMIHCREFSDFYPELK